MPQQILEDVDSTAPLRAKVYFFVLPLVVWAALFAWLRLDLPAQQTFYERYSLLIMASWLGLCWAGLLFPARVGFHAVERGVFWSTAVLMVLNIYYNMLALSSEGLWNSSLWIPLVFVMAYFVFPPRPAWQVSVGIFLAFGAAGLLALAPQVARGLDFDQNSVVQLYVSQLCYLLLFRLLVLAKEHAARVRLEAAKFYQMAHTDPLTGVANHRSMMEALRQALGPGRAGGPVSFVLLDLDRFKQVNDRHGHETGDRVLVHVAQVLRQRLRPGDQLGRWGGEEFVLLLPATAAPEARQLCEGLQRALAQSPYADLPPISASFGVATAAPGDAPDYLVSRADTAMYLSKGAGGNRVEVAG